MLLLVKLRNGAALTWESFNSQERILVMYAAAWLLIMLVSTLVQRSREQMKREIREELAGDGRRAFD